MTEFYIYCDDVSIQTQKIESELINHDLKFSSISDDEKKKSLETTIKIIRSRFEIFRPEIKKPYTQIKSFFNKNFFHVIKLYFTKGSDVMSWWEKTSKYFIGVTSLGVALIFAFAILANSDIKFNDPPNLKIKS